MTTEQKLLAACVGYRAKLDKLEAENAALNETTKKHVSAYYELMAENDTLRIERNRFRATLEDIAELAGAWALDKARAALGKEDKP